MEQTELKVVKSTQSKLSGSALIKVDDLATLSQVNPYFEHIHDGRTNRVYMDLDGKIKGEISEEGFKALDKKIKERLLERMDDVSILTRSSYTARNYDNTTCKWDGTTTPKLSYRLTFIKEAVEGGEKSLTFMKNEIVLKMKRPLLRQILSGIVAVDNASGSDYNLEIDTSVYRGGEGGKMSMVNNRKFPDDDRINTLIKGDIADTIITVCPLVGEDKIKEIQLYSQPSPKDEKVAEVPEEVEEVAEPDDEPVQPKPKPKPAKPLPSPKVQKVGQEDDDAYEMDATLLDTIMDKIGERKKGRVHYTEYSLWWKLVCVFKNEKWDIKILEKYSKKYGGKSWNEEGNKKYYSVEKRTDGYKESYLWIALEQANMEYYEEVAPVRRDIWIFLKNANHEKYSQLYFQLQPDKFIYSQLTGWYSYNPNNTLRHCGKQAPLGLINDVSDILARHINKHGRKCLPEDPRQEDYQPKQKMLNDAIKQLGTSWFAKGIMDYITIHYLNETIDEKIDANVEIIAFNDCIYDLKDGKTRPIERKDFIVKTCKWDFKPDAEATSDATEQVHKFINGIFDEQLAQFWWKVMSLSIFGNKYQKLICHTGTGGNGKGLISAVLKQALGDYYFEPENTFLTTSFKASAPNPTLLLCKGMRIVMTSEPDNGQTECRLNGDFVKQMTGGNTITTRGLHKDPISFLPTFTTHIQANNMPTVKLDGGLQRRLLMMPHKYEFKDTIDPENPLHKLKDDNLVKEIVKPEFIKAFMTIILQTAYENKDKEYRNLGEPTEVSETADKYIGDQNTIKDYLEANYYRDKTETATNKFVEVKVFLEGFNASVGKDRWLTTNKVTKLLKFNGWDHKSSGGKSYILGMKERDDKVADQPPNLLDELDGGNY